LGVLHARTGHDFRAYKQSTLRRRVARRMMLAKVADVAAYAEVLRRDEQECEALFRDLLISVTSFFREPESWQALVREVLPRLIEACPADGSIRAWVPGCA